jgi:hypothetical protein
MARTKQISRLGQTGETKPPKNVARMSSKPHWKVMEELKERERRAARAMRRQTPKMVKKPKPEVFLSGELRDLHLDISNNPCPASTQPRPPPAMTRYRATPTATRQPKREKWRYSQKERKKRKQERKALTNTEVSISQLASSSPD